jgi:hypothetical protein
MQLDVLLHCLQGAFITVKLKIWDIAHFIG